VVKLKILLSSYLLQNSVKADCKSKQVEAKAQQVLYCIVKDGY